MDSISENEYTEYMILDNKTTNIFLDSGDPNETQQAVELLGFLDGQTTNPSLVAKNPEIQERLKTKKFTRDELMDQYKTIILEIYNLIPTGKISAEVYAHSTSSVDDLVSQGRTIATWFPGIYVKLPITESGLDAAKQLVSEGISVNMTLCFTQEQAAAVHTATIDAKATGAHVFISPFIGRLDDKGINGVDLIRNIHDMYHLWGSHVNILGASVRSREHIDQCIKLEISAMTIPLKVIESLTESAIAPASSIALSPIIFQHLKQYDDWREYNIQHELTDTGLAKFVSDWDALVEN